MEKIECIKTELIKVEGENRLKPVNIEGSNYEIPVDYVVMAIGSKPEEALLNSLDLKTNKWGYIETDENNYTTYTFFAPILFMVLEVSIAVFPPPFTTTIFPL